jgi:putative ABC transport system permease protein
MNDLFRDLRHAFRALRNNPGFTLAAVTTLALGLGATTTIFSAVHAVLLEAPPYPAPQELALVTPLFDRGAQPPDTQPYWSYPMFETLRAAAAGAGEFAAFTPTPRRVNLAGEDAAEPVLVEMVSQAYFGILGVTPRVGRFFAPDEDVTPNTHPVAVLSERLWRRTFGADSGIVGRTIRLDATPFTVVGVAPAGFRGLSDRADLWTPMMMAPTLTFSRRLTGQLSFWHMVIARIPTGTDPAPRLAAGARAIGDAIPLAQVFGDGRLRLAAVPLQAARTDRRLGRALLILLGAVGLVLLIACANVASLQLARARRRRRELGIRVALGVGRGRLTRQLFAESVVVALLGGLGGVFLSAWGLDFLNALRPQALVTVGGPGGARLTAAVFAFALAATVGAAVLFGLLPAWWASRADPLSLIRADTGGARRVRSRGALVAVEVALAVVLLAGAGLLVRTVAALNRTPLGFDPNGVAVALVNPPARAYPNGASQRLFRDATDRLANLPNVRGAAAGYCLPVVGGCDHVRMTIGSDADPSSADHEVWLNMVDDAFLATLGIPVVAGRGILPSDVENAPAIALVTEATARRYWPGRNPVGERIRLSVGWPENDGWAEVVGVVRDVRYGDNLRAAAAPGVYLAMAQFSYRANYLVTAVGGDAASAIPAMRAVLRDLDPQLPLWDPALMTRHVETATAGERFSMVLLAAFGALALALAAVGIYGVIAYSVAGRTREIGLRMALGARPNGVLGLVFRQGFGSVGMGLVVGTLGALVTTRVLRAQLYEVSPSDPATLLAVLALLALVAGAAIWIPASRGARVSPMEALRHE